MSRRGERHNSWCFTVNNYDEQDEIEIKSWNFLYVVYGRELGEEKETPHLQGYIEFPFRVSLRQCKRLHETAHWEPRRGHQSQAIEYCKKEGDYVELGRKREQGKRSDFSKLRDRIKEGASEEDIFEEFPDMYFKYKQNIVSTIEDRSLEIDAPEIKLFEWQENLCATLDGEPDDRKINWVVDEIGGAGKTTFSKWLIAKHGKDVFYFTNAQTKDVAFAYKGQRICILDLSRSNAEKVNYGILESVKNGLLFSGKYRSTTKAFNVPHVIVFANFFPDWDKMSMDRWEVIEINKF